MKPDHAQPNPISDLSAARLKKLDGAVQAAEQALQVARERRDAFCRQYSTDNGYCIVLKIEQVRRSLANPQGASNNG